MEGSYAIPTLPLAFDIETKAVLRQASKAHRALAELKGVAAIIPNEGILISMLTMQEAKDSSEVENIVTTQDDLYKADANVQNMVTTSAAKEVLKYRETLQFGFAQVKQKKLLTNTIIKEMQMCLEGNRAGFRTQAGTMLKDNHDHVVYVPPQLAEDIERYMRNLEAFINTPDLCETDPLVKMAIIHHQFESIHPFYDGNGRTGRIINVLYLVLNDLLDLPILYLSRYITQHKSEYYRLMQDVRDKGEDCISAWEEWVLFILRGVEQTARETIMLVQDIAALMQEYKLRLRPLFKKNYKHELINNLFFHPYTKIDYMMRDLIVERKTATKYLNLIVGEGLLKRIKIGRENYYINEALINIFLSRPLTR